MNYDKIYNTLISRAKMREIYYPLSGYVEKHHTIPKCVGENDDKENICILTPEEHYLAHLLLIKMNLYKNHENYNKLIFSAHRMTSGRSYQNRKGNKLYGWLRKIHSIKIKEITDVKGNKNPMYGKKHSDKAKNIMSKKARGRKTWLGKKHKIESKIKIGKSSSIRQTGCKNINYDKNIYKWSHSKFGIINSTKLDLVKKYPEQKITSSGLGQVVRKEYAHHKGWKNI